MYLTFVTANNEHFYSCSVREWICFLIRAARFGSASLTKFEIIWSILSLAGAATSIIFVATNMCSRQCSSFVAIKVCLPRQNYVCRDKCFVAIKTCFFATKPLSRQAYFCGDKRRVLSRQTRVSRVKIMLVATKLLSRQNYVSRDKCLLW